MLFAAHYLPSDQLFKKTTVQRSPKAVILCQTRYVIYVFNLFSSTFKNTANCNITNARALFPSACASHVTSERECAVAEPFQRVLSHDSDARLIFQIDININSRRLDSANEF